MPTFPHLPARYVLTSFGQVWGVTEEYMKANVFPDASDSVLSTLGSVSGMVRAAAPYPPRAGRSGEGANASTARRL